MKHAPPTPSQLDIIAEVNARAARQGSGRRALQFAIACCAILAGAAAWWWMPPAPLPTRQAAPASAPATPADAAATVQAVDRAVATAAPALATEPGSPPAPAREPASGPADAQRLTGLPGAASAPSAEADNRARKLRAKLEAEAQASAVQERQERLRAEAQERLQGAAEPPQTPPQVREVAVAANRGAAESLPEPRRSVDELCQASGNFVSRLLCQTRECRKADHVNDANCVRLREIEESRRRRDAP